jgi:hypothetical protein
MTLTDKNISEYLCATAPLERWFVKPDTGEICLVTHPEVIRRWEQDPTLPRPAKVSMVVIEDNAVALACERFLRKRGHVFSAGEALARFGISSS